MKLVRFDAGNGPRCGVLRGEVVSDAGPGDMAALLGSLDHWDKGESHALATVRLLAPIANPPKIVCA